MSGRFPGKSQQRCPAHRHRLPASPTLPGLDLCPLPTYTHTHTRALHYLDLCPLPTHTHTRVLCTTLTSAPYPHTHTRARAALP
eukprot:362496-Chlamydomonas_euryale.AAC.3